MCGLCGVFAPAGGTEPDLLLRMMTALAHRGPDGSGYYLDDQVGLAHVRLSIIDVAGGAQPMSDADEQIWVAFNGEIFDYIELRDELHRLGHRFRTASDTEVIVHAWREWGLDSFARFNGQWAIALWDRRTGTLVLSRDRFGIHPLHYAIEGRRVLFASEIKALFCDPRVHRELDPDGLDELLTFWSPVPPRTMFAGIRQVMPGTCLIVDADGTRMHEYWCPAFPPQGAEPYRDLDENVVHLRETITAATRLRFQRSDVPVGAYLSGGIDSAVTAATIAEEAGADVHTFSLRFADAEFDEGAHQSLMHKRLHAVHRDLSVTGGDIAAALPEVIWHAESGLLRAGAAPMLLLSRLVRAEGYKVVVTGEGADEVLAGYDLFREAQVRALLAHETDTEVRRRAVERLYPWMRRSPGAAPAFAQGFFARHRGLDDPAFSHRPRWESTAAIKRMLAPDARLAEPDAAADRLVATMPPEATGWDPLSRAQWLELRTLLAGYLLSSQGERMLMANSVEGRFPFLDHRVFEMLARVPADQKIRDLDEKHLLKRAFDDLVPRQIIERPKQPYRSPDAAALLGGPLPEPIADALSPSAVIEAGIWRPEAVDLLLQKGRRSDGQGMGNTDNMRLMAVTTTQLLHGLFLAHWRTPPADPPAPVTMFDRRSRATPGGTRDERIRT